MEVWWFPTIFYAWFGIVQLEQPWKNWLFGIPGIEYLLSICHPSQSYCQLNVNSFLTPLSNSIWRKHLIELYKLKTQQPLVVGVCFYVVGFTPLKFNMEPENGTLEKEIPFWKPSCSGSMLNFGGVTIFLDKNSTPVPPNTLLWQPASLENATGVAWNPGRLQGWWVWFGILRSSTKRCDAKMFFFPGILGEKTSPDPLASWNLDLGGNFLDFSREKCTKMNETNSKFTPDKLVVGR